MLCFKGQRGLYSQILPQDDRASITKIGGFNLKRLDQTGSGRVPPLEISVISPEVFPPSGPNMKHEFSNKISIFYGFLVSFFIHIACVILLKQAPPLNPHINDIEETEVVFVEYPPHRQIVSQKDFNKKTPPDQQRAYLSQADQSVEKQTQAMLKGLFHQGSATHPPSHTLNTNRTPASKNSPNAQQKPQEAHKSEGPTKNIPIQMTLGESAFSFQTNHNPSQTMDFLPGVQLGSHTLLNTKEFRYYSYFSRMKEQLYWRWTSLFREELSALSAQIKKAHQQNLFHTSLYVYLSPEGEIQDISVVKSSGVDSIDDLALYAFMQSAPFPNPPQGLVEEDGYIHIRQSFNLYIQASLFHNSRYK